MGASESMSVLRRMPKVRQTAALVAPLSSAVITALSFSASMATGRPPRRLAAAYGREPRLHTLLDQRPFELRKRPEDVEQEITLRRGGIDLPRDGTLKKRGRPPGSRDKAKVAREERYAEATRAASKELGPGVIDQMAPLDVLTFTMHLVAKEVSGSAAELASMTTPYIHLKLQSITPMNFGAPDFDPENMTDAELRVRIVELDSLLRIATQNLRQMSPASCKSSGLSATDE
jgi:hypothetical protein